MMCWGVVAFRVLGCSREQSRCWGQTWGRQCVHSSPASPSPQLTSAALVSPELPLAAGRAVRQRPAEGLVCSPQQLRTSSPMCWSWGVFMVLSKLHFKVCGSRARADLVHVSGLLQCLQARSTGAPCLCQCSGGSPWCLAGVSLGTVLRQGWC